jgi:hypothetical protein
VDQKDRNQLVSISGLLAGPLGRHARYAASKCRVGRVLAMGSRLAAGPNVVAASVLAEAGVET